MREELLLSGKQKTQDVREKSLLVPDSFEIEIDGICIGDNSQQEGNCIFFVAAVAALWPRYQYHGFLSEFLAPKHFHTWFFDFFFFRSMLSVWSILTSARLEELEAAASKPLSPIISW